MCHYECGINTIYLSILWRQQKHAATANIAKGRLWKPKNIHITIQTQCLSWPFDEKCTV